MKNRMGLHHMLYLLLRIHILMRIRVKETLVLRKLNTLKNIIIIIMARGMRRRET